MLRFDTAISMPASLRRITLPRQFCRHRFTRLIRRRSPRLITPPPRDIAYYVADAATPIFSPDAGAFIDVATWQVRDGAISVYLCCMLMLLWRESYASAIELPRATMMMMFMKIC